MRVAGVAGESAFGTVDYAYDANGNVVSASGGKWRSIAYTSFNLPDSQQGAAGPAGTPRYTWQYDENHQRIRETRVSTAGTRTTWYLHPDNQGGLAFETETAPDGRLSRRHYVNVGGQTVVLVSNGTLPTLGAPTAAPPAPPKIVMLKVEYWLKDHLGSVTSTLDHQGTVTARYAYDPFGKRRQTNGRYDEFGTLVIDWASNVNHGTDRGFTGHEHLDDLGLVHMNGRLYDPTIGRFLQGDPFVQAPDELQNYNRYSYCLNGPLNCTDPTGYISFKKLFKFVAVIAVGYFVPQIAAAYLNAATTVLVMEGAAVITTYTVSATTISIASAAIGGFASAAVATGSLKGAIQGAFSGALFAGIGSIVGDAGLTTAGSIRDAERFAGAIALHGVAGCVSSVASGGKCGPGALSAAFSKAALPATAGLGDGIGRGLAHAVVGGTASELGGGKFSNGALTGAFSYLFNELMHSGWGGSDRERMARSGYSDYQHSRLSNGELLVQSLSLDGDVMAQVLVRRGVDLPLSAIDALMDVSRAANGSMIDVISGARDARAQQDLINAGNPRAAQLSQHTVGIAADFYILGMSTGQAASLTYTAGLFPRVNLYLRSGGAVHVDFLRNRPGVTSFVDWVPK